MVSFTINSPFERGAPTARGIRVYFACDKISAFVFRCTLCTWKLIRIYLNYTMVDATLRQMFLVSSSIFQMALNDGAIHGFFYHFDDLTKHISHANNILFSTKFSKRMQVIFVRLRGLCIVIDKFFVLKMVSHAHVALSMMYSVFAMWILHPIMKLVQMQTH